MYSFFVCQLHFNKLILKKKKPEDYQHCGSRLEGLDSVALYKYFFDFWLGL